MADEPFSERKELDAKREQERRQLVKAYKATFSSSHGLMVLADLNRRFKFGEWAAKDTEDTDKIIRRVFMHGPLHHIEDMRNTSLEKKRLPKQAISENHHETNNPPPA